jgi:hypothetical protein
MCLISTIHTYKHRQQSQRNIAKATYHYQLRNVKTTKKNLHCNVNYTFSCWCCLLMLQHAWCLWLGCQIYDHQKMFHAHKNKFLLWTWQIISAVYNYYLHLTSLGYWMKQFFRLQNTLCYHEKYENIWREYFFGISVSVLYLWGKPFLLPCAYFWSIKNNYAKIIFSRWSLLYT